MSRISPIGGESLLDCMVCILDGVAWDVADGYWEYFLIFWKAFVGCEFCAIILNSFQKEGVASLCREETEFYCSSMFEKLYRRCCMDFCQYQLEYSSFVEFWEWCEVDDRCIRRV